MKGAWSHQTCECVVTERETHAKTQPLRRPAVCNAKSPKDRHFFASVDHCTMDKRKKALVTPRSGQQQLGLGRGKGRSGRCAHCVQPEACG